MNAANQRRLTPVLISVVVVLGVVTLALFGGVGRKVHWGAQRSTTSLPPAIHKDLPKAIPLDEFSIVWQKPLFSPDRKPIARNADGGTALRDLDLTGVILTPGLHMALLHDKNGDRQIRLREGESMPDGGVKLLEVRSRSAFFDSPSGRTELKLPAGAVIDEPKPPTPGSPDPNAQVGSMMRVETNRPVGGRASDMQSGAPSENHQTDSFAERIKANIERRRAARAAATH
jgi:general secretion pathway protein N